MRRVLFGVAAPHLQVEDVEVAVHNLSFCHCCLKKYWKRVKRVAHPELLDFQCTHLTEGKIVGHHLAIPIGPKICKIGCQ